YKESSIALAMGSVHFFANKVNVTKRLTRIYPLIVVPLLGITIVGLAMAFIIDTPIAWVLLE
ncbi:hypothetical protein, partial [Klebsiella aerogenes]|uniref:hypothetical protein n=1 Tax=Klebsiella aerogenes TaxID=548 RepID=UPI0019549DC5